MRILGAVATVLFLLFSISCFNSNKGTNKVGIDQEINGYLTEAMELYTIPGLALAVIEGNNLVYENYFGKASIEDNTLVDNKTIFRVFSTTKLITTTAVFQLIEDGKLKLEDSISKYLEGLPTEWQDVKIKNLLSHSSGLPDFIRYKNTLSDKELMEKLYRDKMQFKTGHQHSYNQTNYWLLAQIIEKITSTPFDDYVRNNQFDGSRNGVLFSSNALEVIPKRATRYVFSRKTQELIKHTSNDGVRGHSGNGLNISLTKFVEWDKKLKTNKLLSENTKSQMWSPFKFANRFAYQKDDFLHGWGLYYVNNLESYGFSGGNVAAYRYFPGSKTTIILLSNGYQTPAFDIIINDIARITIPELRAKKSTLEAEVMKLVMNHQLDEASQSLKVLNEENPNTKFDNLKWNINGFGNSYAWNEEFDKGFEIFKLNAHTYPDWWVSISALAESFDQQKDTLNAIRNYERSVKLNEKNEYDYNEQMIKRAKELKNQ
ncbi:MAG: serine hydrolase domain-containing protein [Bacteroidota bacterium]